MQQMEQEIDLHFTTIRTEVLLSNGYYGIIVENKLIDLDSKEETYNFEVEVYHNNYVCEDGILVHNRKCNWIEESVPDDYKPDYKNVVYEHNPKHYKFQHGKVRAKMPSQEHGQYALDHVVPSRWGGKAL